VPSSCGGRVGGIASRPPGGLRIPAPSLVSLDTLNITLPTDLPTGFDQTPATPSPGSPLDPDTFDRLFAKVFAYRELGTRFSDDMYLNLEHLGLTSLVYGVLPDNVKELFLGHNPLLEIDCALLPKTVEILDLSHCRSLERVLNIDQLPNLAELVVQDTPVQTLSRLPPTLVFLDVSHCHYLTALPNLTRTNLHRLDMDWTHMETIPQLPETLHTFCARFSRIGVEFPMLPDSLQWLELDHSTAVTEGFLPDRPDTVTYTEYAETARKWWNACLRRERYDLLHESLMMAAWHPDRVSRWLEHSEETLDMMMGC